MPAPNPDLIPVVVDRNYLIPMPDGVELAADCYRPAEPDRWPAILTFIPYHKDGRGGRLDVEAVNRYFAGRGYAALTIDLRGLGSSGGVNRFPFDPQEARDGYEVVEWIARQTWCDGNVGMWGVSYGGVTALSVAATRPPHLKAIVPIHASADLYHDVVAPRVPGWLLAGGRLGPEDGGLQPDAAALPGSRRSLGAGLARAPRGLRSVALRLVGPSGLRRVLAVAGDTRQQHRVPDVRHRRLA